MLNKHFLLANKALMNYITHMATQKPQILLTLDDDLFKRINDFRFNAHINSRSEAIRLLIEQGLKTSIPSPKLKKK
jgi:metal-responsive CopG/Arc/MetJ family transcriptional regulator